MIEINKNPSRKELAWFGLLCLAFFGLIGLSALHKTHALHGAVVIWTVAAAFVAFYFAFPPFQRPIYLGWMYAAYPIGWAVSILLLTVAFFGVFAPIGFLMRAMSRDPLTRKFDRSAPTYWSPHEPGTDPERYFRQF
jgi:Saxitoxin biosynthesis operon protein SxtJ